MDWERVSNDELEIGVGQFLGLSAAALAEVCAWLVEVDRRQMFLSDGSPTIAQWVSARFGWRHSTAAMLVRVALRLQDLPLLKAKLATGELSLDQVDAISRMATPDTEAGLIDECLGWSVAALDRAARRANPPSAEQAGSVWERRRLHMQWNLDESELAFGGRLPGIEGKVFESSVRERADRIPPNPETGIFDPYPARLADGLVEVCATSTEGAAAPVQVTVHADLDALTQDREAFGVAEVEGGPLIANETARRLACDAFVECVVYDHARTLGVGRRSRRIPGWLRRLLWNRDGGCQFPGCGTTRWVHGHHIIHWADSGPTDLENLILLCGWHHRFLHEHGWSISQDVEGRFRFHRPDGSLYPPATVALDPRLRELARTI